MRTKYNDNNVEENENQEISRRGFLGDILGYGTAFLAGVPFVQTARAIGSANHDLLMNSFTDRELSDKLHDVQNNIQLKREEKYAPGNFSFEQASDRLILAKTIFCEGEEAYRHNDYMRLIGIAPLRRANLTGWDIKKVVSSKGKNKQTGTDRYAFSFMNPADEQNLEFNNPLRYSKAHPEKVKAWSKAYETAEELFPLTMDKIDPHLTHFYVDTIEAPEWAVGKKPVRIIKYNGKTTYFYDIPEHFSKRE